MIIFKNKILNLEVVEILHVRIDDKLRRWVGLTAYKFLYQRYMSVIYMCICYNMYQLPRFQSADLGKHMDQGSILTYIPVVSYQYILRPLV